jgi:hypothetical protein
VDGDLTVADGAIIRTVGGALLLNNTSSNGNITIGSGSSILAFNGDIAIFNGTEDPRNVNTTPPANVVANVIGGSITFGPGSITANDPTNRVSVNGASVVFDRRNGSILLEGGTTIRSSSTVIDSLDLMDPNVVSFIKNGQDTGVYGGSLTVSGGIAVGGTLSLLAADIETLTAMRIPASVTLSFVNFGSSAPVNVSLNSSSTTGTVTINGATSFTSTGTGTSAIGVLNIQTDLEQPALALGTEGLLRSAGADGTLTVNTNGQIVATGAGQISAVNLNLSASSIGAQQAPIKITARALTANATGKVFLSETGTVFLGASSASEFSLKSTQ